MARVSANKDPGHFQGRPPSLAAWIVGALLVVPIIVLLVADAWTLIGAAEPLGYLATRATVFDTWAVLSLVLAVLSFTAIVGAAIALRRRRLVLALAFTAMGLPAPLILEGSRCDTAAACHMLGWAALPIQAFNWQARLRPVTERNEAEWIASGALGRAGSTNSPFKAKRFADHWIVSTIDQDGRPGANAVRVDTRTGRTSLVACPPDQIQCGMEQPVVSDGRRVFRNEKMGVAATFPASRPVCTSRGKDDHPRGFYAMMRAPDMPCDVLDDSRLMGVEVAQSGRSGCASLDAQSLLRPLTPGTARLFRTPPKLGGAAAVACEAHRDDDIQISIFAFAPPPADPGGSPGTLYEGYMVTTRAHLAEDVRSFEHFLEGVRIGSAARERTD
jgi:hypothetical protein